MLIKAAMLGKEDIVRLLLDAGAAKEIKEYDVTWSFNFFLFAFNNSEDQ